MSSANQGMNLDDFVEGSINNSILGNTSTATEESFFRF